VILKMSANNCSTLSPICKVQFQQNWIRSTHTSLISTVSSKSTWWH